MLLRPDYFLRNGRYGRPGVLRAQPVPTPTPPPAPAVSETDRRLAQLQKLGELKAQGVLTDAEFETEKARILN